MNSFFIPSSLLLPLLIQKKKPPSIEVLNCFNSVEITFSFKAIDVGLLFFS